MLDIAINNWGKSVTKHANGMMERRSNADAIEFVTALLTCCSYRTGALVSYDFLIEFLPCIF